MEEKAYFKIMITSRKFGKLPNGETVTAYDFSTKSGFRATILSYGATLQSLIFPGGTDVVLGFDTLEEYLTEHPYFGAIIGRVANRISGAGFEIDGEYYELPKNENGNNLHSGPAGFDRMNWHGDIKENTLILRHQSPNGHQGFPGALWVELRFSFEGSTLSLHIQAAVDKPCPVNITYHPYFNLTDGGASPCRDHQLQILSDSYTPTGIQNIPTGEKSPTASDKINGYNTPKHITADDVLDLNFVIKTHENDANKMVKMAKLSSDTTGHKIIVCSTQPCLQAYMGAYIPKLIGKSGVNYGPNHGITLEPQSYPDAVNQKKFLSNILRPGELYSHRINYTFRPGEAQA